jgi:hypothetical protein
MTRQFADTYALFFPQPQELPMTDRSHDPEYDRLRRGLTSAGRALMRQLASHDGMPQMVYDLAADGFADEMAELKLFTSLETEIEADRSAFVDEVDLKVNGPLPQRDGRPADFDPDTGEWDLK